jgi:hypothetical protein
MTISIKPTASGSTIEQDGSTILTVDGSGNISTPNNLTVSGSLSAASGGGKVLQVLATNKTDTFSGSVASAGELDITGLSVTITPSSTSSKILVLTSVFGHNTSEGGLTYLIHRNGSTIVPADSGGGYGNGITHGGGISIANTAIPATYTYTVLDSPSSISALTYKIRIFNLTTTTRTMYVNRAASDTRVRGTSTITVMEIAG